MRATTDVEGRAIDEGHRKALVTTVRCAAGTAHELASAELDDRTVALWWLGQAGFALRGDGLRILVDPYLSDSLAVKYAGREFAHTRMMDAPMTAAEADGIDLVLCTHKHSDHMDAETLSAIAGNSPACIFVVPRSQRCRAVEIGLPGYNTVLMDDGDFYWATDNLRIEAVASAHEQMEQDARGRHRFLGYVLSLGGVTLYHSGDCVPYPGLARRLASRGIDVALLPVNGRDRYRLERGVAGNFTFEEAAELCRDAHISALVCHHWGMFAFNTVDERELRTKAGQLGDTLRCVIPDTSSSIVVTPPAGGNTR